MKRLVVLETASAMAKEAYIWYEEQEEHIGERFIAEVEDAYHRLKVHPEIYAKVSKKYRQLKLHGFPYIVVFEINGDTVYVYSIFHTSRNPKKKLKR